MHEQGAVAVDALAQARGQGGLRRALVCAQASGELHGAALQHVAARIGGLPWRKAGVDKLADSP